MRPVSESLGVGSGLLDTLGGFVEELRRSGIPVSLTENLDAVEALRHLPLEDRSVFKYALAATLVKREAHWQTFDTVFEVYFSSRGRRFSLLEQPDGEAEGMIDQLLGTRESESGAGDPDGLSAEELDHALLRALLEDDQALLAVLARAAVNRYAGMEAGRPVGGTYYLFRTLRQLEFDGLLERLVAQTPPEPDELAGRLVGEEYRSRLERLRDEIEAEIRRRLVADRGADAVAKSVRRPLPEDVEFMHATRDELVLLRRAVGPLTRKLAVRLARKRRHRRRGPLDFRSTVRHSLAYGGVPADPRFKPPRPAKPELVVVADISGSVAAFARFTLQLVHALSAEFSRVRSFVFIDGVDEVTSYFGPDRDVADAVARINTEADVIWTDGHSDYGHALSTFWDRWGREVGPKSTVLVLGDARNNYHATEAWALGEVQRRARLLYWLNPEPRSYWDTGDSVINAYAPFCHGVYECRNLAQLEHFVEALA